jgi:hypothetical protein
MKTVFWIGLVTPVLGIVSLFVPAPRNERESIKVAGVSVGIETRHDDTVSPIVSGVLLLSGAGMMIAGSWKA